MSPCSFFFCPLPALLLHFPLLFFSITLFLKLADCSFGFILQTASMICQSASADSNFGGEKWVDRGALIRKRNPNYSLPSYHPNPKINTTPPGISYFNICGAKGTIHSCFPGQDTHCLICLPILYQRSVCRPLFIKVKLG